MTLKHVREQRLFVVALLLILIDQVTKVWIKGFHILGLVHEGMPLESSRQIFGELLRFSYVENPGMAFGVSFGSAKIFLSLFSIIAAGGLAWYLHKLRHSTIWVQLGVMLLLAGAVGNLIDRVFYGLIYNEAPLFYGKVVDFIDVDCPDFSLFGHSYTRWWVFNVADACVSCGITLLVLFNHKIPTLKSLDSRFHVSNDEIHIEEYNPQWAHEFAELKTVLERSLGGKAQSIEHVGSTSIPGLAAKAVMDVDIVIAEQSSLDEIRTTLEALGYVYEGDKGIPGREAFRQSDSMVPHGSGHRWMRQHMYVCASDSLALAEHRQFREALLNSSELQAQYVALKRELAEKFRLDREAYTNGKADWIRSVLSAATTTTPSVENSPEEASDTAATDQSDESESEDFKSV